MLELAALLHLPVHDAVSFVLVRPHYPENVGAAARAIKTMGFERLILVKPSRIAVPEHVMARKMAVKALDVLDSASRVSEPEQVLSTDCIRFGTTSRRGVSHVQSPRDAARSIVELSASSRSVAVLLGNEKTGLDSQHLDRCHHVIRIPMAADQPSINLAQAVQILAYEIFVAALLARKSS